ncbi:hypothetical protein [Brevibacillus brevis]|uniref:hypothetical protein n=1 Tax=Brevibacillus brevis TaxID=1393 RepID=UPI0007D8BF69|nr:hypothetical protein [Brevibacillus brevis]
MIQNLPSHNRFWLKESHEKRSDRAFRLVKLAVESLKAKGVSITYANIEKESKIQDPAGMGIHRNTIKSNLQCHEYYAQHSSTYKKKKRKKESTARGFKIDGKAADSRKNQVLMRRYSQLTKDELICRLIQFEEQVTIERNNHNTKVIDLLAELLCAQPLNHVIKNTEEVRDSHLL